MAGLGRFSPVRPRPFSGLSQSCPSRPASRRHRLNILLSSVIGPYGVDDPLGRKENVMELFHNQVTREQGLFSIRYNHPSFGLHLIAENIGAPTRILDFPSEERFVREIRKGYDYVGISFILPNLVKAQRMAKLVREHSPHSRIILGGHGTALPDIAERVDCDHVCKGEGVKWFRELLGEDSDRPIQHPLMLSGFSKRIMGVPLKTESAVLIPGVGCPNACRFCCTSHFFDKTYTPYFDTGRELFDICVRAEKKLGVNEFFIMDENFLKRPERARELLSLMEANGKSYRFMIFSSAETVKALGPEFMARLGVSFIWIGVESKREVFEKNAGIDIAAMIRSLRDHGISVLASGILFLEHHDRASIREDIDFMVGLESDFVQFMQLGPIPNTRLYREYDADGKIRHDVPFEEWHGQHRIWFDHPKFTPEETETILRDAFRLDFDTHGSSLMRVFETTLRGYRTLSRSADPILKRRSGELLDAARHFRPALAVMKKHAHNERVLGKVNALIAAYREVIGPPTLVDRFKSTAMRVFAARESARVSAGTNVYQPVTLDTPFRMSIRDLVAEKLKGRSLSSILNLDVLWKRGAVLVNLGGTIDRVNARALSRKLRAFLTSKDDDVVIVLDHLVEVENSAFKRLLSSLSRYRNRLRLVFEGGSDAVRSALSGLPENLSSLVTRKDSEHGATGSC